MKSLQYVGLIGKYITADNLNFTESGLVELVADVPEGVYVTFSDGDRFLIADPDEWRLTIRAFL